MYLDQKLSEGRKVELPEMLKYYNEHLHDKEYDRPAQITWRELVVEKGHHPNPADARRKADNLLARLNRGEDFATLARTESEGPSSIRAQGGLMQTSPGSYAVEAVNQAPQPAFEPGQPGSRGPQPACTSCWWRPVATPGRPRSRRSRTRCASKVMYNKMRKARDGFSRASSKRDALISTIFDGTESDPAATDKE